MKKKKEEAAKIKKEIARYKEILEKKRAELEEVPADLGGIVVVASPDPVDQAGLAGLRELAASSLGRDRAQLRMVYQALKRVKEGTFGVCASCKQDIAPKRLSAIPWTPFCIVCQTREDQQAQNQKSGPVSKKRVAA